MKSSKKTFVVRYRHTAMCEVVIEAKDEASARQLFKDGEFSDALEVDSIDAELVSIKEERS